MLGVREEFSWRLETRKKKIKSRFYKQAVTEPANKPKQNWTIFEVRYSMYEYEFYQSEK
jgi:hypothetical protein